MYRPTRSFCFLLPLLGAVLMCCCQADLACADVGSADNCPPLEAYSTSVHPGAGTSWFGGYRIISCETVDGGGSLDAEGELTGLAVTLKCDNCTKNCSNKEVKPQPKNCSGGGKKTFTETLTWTFSGEISGSVEAAPGWAANWLASGKVTVGAKFAGQRASSHGAMTTLNFGEPVNTPSCEWAMYYRGIRTKTGRAASVTRTVTPEYEVYCKIHKEWVTAKSKSTPKTLTLHGKTDFVIGEICDDTLANGKCNDKHPKPNWPATPDPTTHVCGS